MTMYRVYYRSIVYYYGNDVCAALKVKEHADFSNYLCGLDETTYEVLFVK